MPTKRKRAALETRESTACSTSPALAPPRKRGQVLQRSPSVSESSNGDDQQPNGNEPPPPSYESSKDGPGTAGPRRRQARYTGWDATEEAKRLRRNAASKKSADRNRDVVRARSNDANKKRLKRLKRLEDPLPYQSALATSRFQAQQSRKSAPGNTSIPHWHLPVL
ncbi:hypothetical protein HMN09_00380800 [Mycena chlorophos]|uniref:Uncharacterized protein n=1 Tax=Mycena chlorophos TaxID=658473 RepID=A0A8H6WJ02_MYCCL|nr:hypothetical protein HMN09_00380800 [Mycena chlorophos]